MSDTESDSELIFSDEDVSDEEVSDEISVDLDENQKEYFSSDGSEMELKLTVNNNTNEDLPDDTYMIVRTPNFQTAPYKCMLGSIRSGDHQEVTVRPRVRKDRMKDPFQHVKVIFRSESKGHLTEITLDLRFEKFFAVLKEYCYIDEPLTIVTFGWCGTGKTSFISTLTSMTSYSNVPIFKDIVIDTTEIRATANDQSHGESNHGTRHLRFYKPEEFDSEFFHYTIVDVMGVDHGNYKSGEITKILLGELTQGFDLAKGITRETEEQLKKAKDNTSKRSPDAMLFFVSMSVIEDTASQNRLKEVLSEVMDFGIAPLLVVSRIDDERYFPEVREDPNAPLSDEADNSIQMIADIFGIPMTNVYISLNYKPETERNFDLEMINFKLFQRAVENAADYRIHRKPGNRSLRRKYCDDYQSDEAATPAMFSGSTDRSKNNSNIDISTDIANMSFVPTSLENKKTDYFSPRSTQGEKNRYFTPMREASTPSRDDSFSTSSHSSSASASRNIFNSTNNSNASTAGGLSFLDDY